MQNKRVVQSLFVLMMR